MAAQGISENYSNRGCKMKTSNLITAHDLEVKFDSQIIFQNVDFQVQKGDFFVLWDPMDQAKPHCYGLF